MENTFTGIFISAELLADEKTSLQEKVLLSMISSLDNNGCTAKNEYFANILHMTTRRVREIITSLETKGYIRREEPQGKRRIFVVNPVKQVQHKAPIKPKEEPAKPKAHKKPYVNKSKSKNPHFTNTYSHNWDLQALERLEQAYVALQVGDLTQDEYQKEYDNVYGNKQVAVIVEPSECIGNAPQIKFDVPQVSEEVQRLLDAGFTTEQIAKYRSNFN